MIPNELMLVLWIPVSALFMMDRNSARGFTFAFVLGMLILPERYGIELPGVPDIEKLNVAAIGVLIGTVLFHPGVFERFRLMAADLCLVVCAELAFLTSYLNDFGPYDGLSQVMEFALNYMLPIFLARLHLGTPSSLRTFLLGLIIAAVCYVPLALWEFRMSPQIHTKLYGYFQHVFQQHYRAGFWRPIVCFRHALDLGRFFAFTAFLAALPMRRDIVALFESRRLGFFGNFLFLIPLAGLFASLSWGPYMLFVLLCGGYFFIHRVYWAIYIPPLVGLLWICAFFLGYEFGFGSVGNVASFNQERAQSFEYRLIAMKEYESIIVNRPWFGHGGWGHGRIEGRATDSQVLISLLARGFVGAAFYFGWWFLGMRSAMRVARVAHGTVLNKRARAVAIMMSLALLIVVIDSALALHVMLALSGVMGIHAWLRTDPQIPTLSTFRRPPDAAEPGKI